MARIKRPDINMTEGPLLPQLIRFSVPLMLSSLLQLLYNAADMIVVGQYAGAQSLAAVGSTSALINLVTNLFIGFSLGANVVIARANGAGDQRAIFRNVHTAIALSLVSGVLVMVVGFFTARPLLKLMGSPDDVIDLATLYMQIFFLGMPVNMLYNFGSGIMRAVGDTKRPLFYLAVSGLANVLLNLLLVIVFKMDVAGVAIATVVSQLLSALFVFRHLTTTDECIHLEPRAIKLEMKYAGPIIRIGLPAGIQSSLFSFSNVIIQSSINFQGSLWMAGNAAGSNIESFVYVVMNSISQGTLTFSSTNLGAQKYRRVRRVLWVSLLATAISGFAVGMGALTFGNPLLGLYNSNPDVISRGLVRMSIILPFHFLCGLMDVSASQMRGMGYSIAPMIVSLSGACVFRLIWVYTIFKAFPQMEVLYYSYPISWGLTFLAHLLCFFFMALPKLRKLEEGALSPQPE